jgi:hypothetical protein
MPLWLELLHALAEAAKDIATVLAILLGGWWTLYRFGLSRERETKLGIDLSWKSLPYHSGCYIVSFDVIFSNQGSSVLKVQRKRCPAFDDSGETLKYGCDLLLRRVPIDLQASSQIQWFRSGAKSPYAGDLEFDLVDEYEIDGKTDFWLEPGETYHVGVAVVLEPGTFLVLVTFVGDASVEDFWRRSFVMQVPGEGGAVRPADQPKESTSVYQIERGSVHKG